MATQPVPSRDRNISAHRLRTCATLRFHAAPFLFCLTLILPWATTVQAQLQQPFVYTTGGGIATRSDATGALTPTAASPLPVLGFPVVIDAKGRFLFAAGNDSIHMYQVDALTGAYTEVPGSPFASANTNGPILIATEPTGTYLGVVNATGLNPGESSVESFQIDSVGEALIPVQGSFLELVSSPIGAAGNPTLGTLYVYLGPNPVTTNPAYQQDGELLVYTIDPQTGLLGTETGADGSTSRGRSFAADPLGRFVVSGQGKQTGSLEATSAAGAQGAFTIGSGIFPQEIFVAPGEHFVYVTLFAGANSVVHIYILDTTTWELSEAPSSPLPGFTSIANFVADPTGPFVYESTAPNQVRVYSVDPSTGYFVEVAGSPFLDAGFGLPVAFSVDAGATQPVVGPVATFTPTDLSLGSIPVGTPSVAQSILLSSTGDQALSVNGISVSGMNAGEFSESDDCGVPTVLQPKHSCMMFIIFTPAASGTRQAQLSVLDNATGSPQGVAISGVGIGSPPAAPAITFLPGTVNFPPLAQGSTSLPQSVLVTNSGNAALNISAIALAGNNTADFSNPSGNCVGTPIAPGNSCTVTESFTPLAGGQRQAMLMFTDNASGSTHFVTLVGTGIGQQPSSGPAVKMTPISVNFPVTTQGLASTAISVTITNSGAAPLHISGISAGGASPADFANTFNACNTTTIAANASCSVSITFSPIFSGARSETLFVSDDAPNSPQSVSVFANAPAAFTVSSPASALSVSVNAGQSATYNLQLTPGLDFNGTIAFACSGAPIGANCQAPASVTLNTGVPATYTVTVPTSGGALMLPRDGIRTWPRWPTPSGIAAPACVLVLWILVFRFYGEAGARRLNVNSQVARWGTIGAMLALLLFVPAILALQGCGGGSANSAPVPQGNAIVTPRGTSLLTLTPSATGPSGKALQLAPIQLTLIVN